MFCPVCSTENQGEDFCRSCNTNLAIIGRFLAREDSNVPRNRLLSRTGHVSFVVSEGFAWTLLALVSFVSIIVTAKFLLPPDKIDLSDVIIASAAVIVMILLCGVPLLLGLVLILKDLPLGRAKSGSEKNGRETPKDAKSE